MEVFAPIMSRVTYLDDEMNEKELIIDMDECRYKVNGRCYNNFGDYIKLGKKCYLGEKCTHFLLEEQEEDIDERREHSGVKDEITG